MSQTCYPNLSSEANKANVLRHLSKRALVQRRRQAQFQGIDPSSDYKKRFIERETYQSKMFGPQYRAETQEMLRTLPD